MSQNDRYKDDYRGRDDKRGDYKDYEPSRGYDYDDPYKDYRDYDYDWNRDVVVKLIDARSDKSIEVLGKGKTTIRAKDIPDQHDATVALFIRKGSPLFGKVDTVHIDLNDGQATNLEGRGPFSLYDDFDRHPGNVDYLGGFIPDGHNTIDFTINLKNGRHKTISRDFAIVKKPKDPDLKVGIFDAHSDTLITRLEDGDKVPASLLKGRPVTIAAVVPKYNPYYSDVESVFLDFNHGHITRIENEEPYALLGDNKGDLNGAIGLIPKGKNNITFDLFSKDDLRGDFLGTVDIDFKVVRDDPYYY